MNVQVYLILKVMDKNISVIGIDNKLPNLALSDSKTITGQIDDFLKSEFDLMGPWLDIRHVCTKTMQKPLPHLAIFYSSFVPKDFINGKNIEYIREFGSMDIEIQEEIQSSLRIPAY